MTAELVKKWLIPRLISGNLAIWTVLALEKLVLYCFWVPREMNFRFSSKTQWQMFLLVSGRHVGAHPDGHQHGVSIQNSVDMGNTLLRIACECKKNGDLILGEVVYIAIIYYIPDSWINLLHDYDFYFWSHDWWKPRIDLVRCIQHVQRLASKFILDLPFLYEESYRERLLSIDILPICYWHEFLDLFLFSLRPPVVLFVYHMTCSLNALFPQGSLEQALAMQNLSDQRNAALLLISTLFL